MTDVVAAIVGGLAAQGYAAVPDALPRPAIAALRDRAAALASEGALVPAQVRSARREVRGDSIAWLDEAPSTPAETVLLAWLAALRDACNRELLLGLFDFEGHYALYPPGAAYARHRDRFRDDDARVLSCVLYLNDAWRREEGGALRLYVGEDAPLDVFPEGGTLVAFLSDTFEHEVLPATRERIALAGWFRRRALLSP